MKPHEETWVHESDEGVHFVTTGPDGFRGTFDDAECAKLAAQAPAMARLLLKLEWSAEPDDGGSCPVCGGWAPGVAGINAGHHAGCELATVLRAAGVLP